MMPKACHLKYKLRFRLPELPAAPPVPFFSLLGLRETCMFGRGLSLFLFILVTAVLSPPGLRGSGRKCAWPVRVPRGLVGPHRVLHVVQPRADAHVMLEEVEKVKCTRRGPVTAPWVFDGRSTCTGNYSLVMVARPSSV